MKALIFGATGLLGKALTREWNSDHVIGLGSHDVDIRDAAKDAQERVTRTLQETPSATRQY